MQVRVFSIPATGDPAREEELNRFLRSQRVLAIHRQFVADGMTSYWALLVEYLEGPAKDAGRERPGGARVDYKQILSPEDFAVFVNLRQWRKAAAEEEGVPVYTIFTNEQLAEIARLRPSTRAKLGEIQGIGEGRLRKYADGVLEVLASDAHPPMSQTLGEEEADALQPEEEAQ